ncbi:MAG: DUF3365 domain-containing protein [Capnocytophaga sp.]|nr:DUF3365 domain-containing protein [Capnocytophaga sp.]
MKHFAFFFSVLAVASCKQKTTNELSHDRYLTIGTEYAVQTQQLLGKNLLEAIQNEGVEEAIRFCNIKAMPLTDSVAQQHSADIKRVTDKPRNLDNKANAQELKIIKAYKEALAKGESLKPQLIEEKDKVVYYSPILTNMMCLQCHGSSDAVLPETMQVLTQLYPDDQATGYDENQVRGLFSIRIDK